MSGNKNVNREIYAEISELTEKIHEMMLMKYEKRSEFEKV